MGAKKSDVFSAAGAIAGNTKVHSIITGGIKAMKSRLSSLNS